MVQPPPATGLPFCQESVGTWTRESWEPSGILRHSGTHKVIILYHYRPHLYQSDHCHYHHLPEICPLLAFPLSLFVSSCHHSFVLSQHQPKPWHLCYYRWQLATAPAAESYSSFTAFGDIPKQQETSFPLQEKYAAAFLLVGPLPGSSLCCL